MRSSECIQVHQYERGTQIDNRPRGESTAGPRYLSVSFDSVGTRLQGKRMHNLREQRARSTEHYTLRNTDFVPAKALRCLQCLPTRALIGLCWAIQVAIFLRLRSPLVAQKVLLLAANWSPYGPLTCHLKGTDFMSRTRCPEVIAPSALNQQSPRHWRRHVA